MPFGGLDFPEIAAVYARFAALTGLSRLLGGELVLYPELDRDGIAVAIASNVAGAASLGLEPDAARAKEVLRAGVCDFVVNTLDEALRILKNEIRKRRAVSVILTADADAAVAEIIARGVQPDILAWPVKELVDRGALLLRDSAEDGLKYVSWTIASEPPRWLPKVDAQALDSLSIRDARVRWIEAAPRYLGRAYAGRRFLRMSDAEVGAFVSAVRAAVKKGDIPVAVSVARGDGATVITP